jgi:histidyl-tRNA synthetase
MTMHETNLINNRIQSILGQFDTSPEYFQSKQDLIIAITKRLYSFDFDLSDYPLIEPTELYVRKSGGEITNSLYSFIDPGGNRVSLRPEFTASVIRSYIEDDQQYSIPMKRQYVGPVFRYQTFFDKKPTFRQFTQQGCELIGLNSIDTDALILRLALMSLAESGLSSIVVKIGHVGFIRKILQKYDLTEAMCLFVLSHLKDLAGGELPISSILDEASNIGLISNNFNNPKTNKETWTRDSVKFSFKELLSSSLGRRSEDQIVDRFLDKISNDSVSSDRFNLALNELSEFIIENKFSVSSDSKMISKNSNVKVQQYVESLVNMVGDIDNLNVQYEIDFAIQRGLTYYTGLIFDLEGIGKWEHQNLGGGGRYDGLVKSMGNDIALPAIGFAINIESIMKCIKS